MNAILNRINQKKREMAKEAWKHGEGTKARKGEAYGRDMHHPV
jgi:hypothetical protein